MTKSEAIHRAALRKHRHKGNYIVTHEALLAEALEWDLTGLPEVKGHPQRRSLWQIIKGWFA